MRSPDGKFIVFLKATGIYELNVRTKAIHKVSNNAGYGGFDWR